ncbi:MAG: site-specific integrase [Candidatus Acidiferrum sp.]
MNENAGPARKSFEKNVKTVAAGSPPRGHRKPKAAKRELRFRDLVESALEAKKLRGNEESSLRTDRSRLRRILPSIGDLKLQPPQTGRLERFLESLARGDASHKPVSGGTVNRFRSLMSSIFQHALRQGLIDVNPLAGGSIPWSKEPQKHDRFLEPDEQLRLLAVIRRDCPEKADEVELAILTGMRRGEQFNAKWADWKSPRILYVMGKTGPRKVRINRAARRCLLRMRKHARGEFITPERNDVERDRRVWFEKAVKKADLRPAFRYHDLRHTFCSRLVAAGVPLVVVQKLAGHKSYSTTLRYSHLADEQLDRECEKVAF